jgi:hypothetical protein
MIDSHVQSKDYGLLSLVKSRLPIDFKPFELSEKIIGIQTGIPLDHGTQLDWNLGALHVKLRVVSSKSVKNGVYNTKLALDSGKLTVSEVLKNVAKDEKGNTKTPSKSLQAVRFPLKELCEVRINTFGSKHSYGFELVDISRSGALVEKRSGSLKKAPFLENTLIEVRFDSSRSPLFSFKGAPQYLIAKVIRTRHAMADDGHIEQYGLKLVSSETGEDPAWMRLVNRMEEVHLRHA